METITRKEQLFFWLTRIAVSAYVGEYSVTERVHQAYNIASAWRINVVNECWDGHESLKADLTEYYESV